MTPERRRDPRKFKDPMRRVERRVLRGATPCWILQRVWTYADVTSSIETLMFRTERGLLTKKPEDAETFDTEAQAIEFRRTLRWPVQWVPVEYTARD